MEWSNSNVRRFIALYKDRSVLWDPTHPSYKIYSKKYEAWEEIGAVMEVPVEELKKKMGCLLATYRKLRRQVIQRPSDELTWFAYDSFHFMHQIYTPKFYPVENPNDNAYEAFNNRDDSESGITLAELIARQIALSDPSDGNKCEEDSLLESNGMTKVETSDGDAEERSDYGQEESTSRRKRRKVEKINNGRKARKIKISPAQSDNFDEGNSDRISDCGPARDYGSQRRRSARQSDDCASFGRYIADKLKTYNWATKCAVQHTISEVLFNADQGRFETFCSYNATDTDARVLLRTAVEEEKPVEETLPSSAGSQVAGGAED